MTTIRHALYALVALLFFSACSTRSDYGDFEMNGISNLMMKGLSSTGTQRVERPDTQLDPVRRRVGAVGFGFEEKLETPEQAVARKKTVDRLFKR